MINQDIIEKHIQAGKIAATCLQYGKSLIKPGAKIKDILDSVENKISERSFYYKKAHHTIDNDNELCIDKIIKILG